jgi:hypothetical protein
MISNEGDAPVARRHVSRPAVMSSSFGCECYLAGYLLRVAGGGRNWTIALT